MRAPIQAVHQTRSTPVMNDFQSLYQSLVETLPVNIFCKDKEGRFNFGNSSYCAGLGKPLCEILGKTDREFFPSALADKYRRDDQQVMASGKVFETVEQHQTPTGERKYVHVFKVPLRDHRGEIAGIHCMFWDITEQKQAEDRVREQANMLDQAQDSIVAHDLDLRVRYWNKGSEVLLGWTAEEAVGHKITELVYKEPAVFEAAQKQALAQGEWLGELHLVNKDGRKLIVSSRWTLLRDVEGNPKSVVAINTDVTDRKKLETQFLRSQRMESLGLLAAGIAHDLNNILTPILLSASLMREGRLGEEEIRKIMDMIQTNAQRGVDIVKQLLTFGRGSLGERIIVQPRHLVRDMVKMAQQTFPKNILINTQIADDLWSVMGDPTQIHQLVLNLCLNARDAMPHGGMLTIAAENVVLDDYFATQNLEAAAGPYVLFTLADNGTGIAPQILHKIFDPFFTTKEVGKGTGLGLSTVLGIAKGHGGFVKVYSEPGRGSTFNVYLPAAPEAGAPEAAKKTDTLPRGQGELILLVDDEKPILDITQKVLERHGYQVLTAGDGTEALALFAQLREKIRVVLTDVSMPVMDGVALVRVLRKMEPGLNVIAASGRGSGGKASEMKVLGIEKFLAKPYAVEKLMKTLHELLRGEKSKMV